MLVGFLSPSKGAALPNNSDRKMKAAATDLQGRFLVVNYPGLIASTIDRIASGRLSPAIRQKRSSFARRWGCIRTTTWVPLPVGLGPRRFRATKVSRFAMEQLLSY